MDSALRALRRTWLESQDVEDEARYLRERIRQGELDPRRVELCAWLGHRAASKANGKVPPAGAHVPWNSWAAGLDGAGWVVVYRGLLEFRIAPSREDDTAEPWQGLESALEEWLDTPDEGRLGNLRAAWERTRDATRFAVRHFQVGDLVEDILAVQAGEVESNDWFLYRLCLADGEATTDTRVAQRLVSWALGAEHDSPVEDYANPLSPDRESEFLASRLEQRGLLLEQLQLAAYAGHRPARQVLEDLGQEVPTSGDDEYDSWLAGLERWGLGALLEAIFGAVRFQRPLRDVRDLPQSTQASIKELRGEFNQLLEESCDRRAEKPGDSRPT